MAKKLVKNKLQTTKQSSMNPTKEEILQEYDNASQVEKKLLERLYTKDYFFKSTITRNIKSYTDIHTLQDALEGLGVDRNLEIPVIKALSEQIALMPKSVLDIGDIYCLKSMAEMIIITKALNKDYKTGKLWLPDWSNSIERKYYPWFNMSASGFSFDGCGDSGAISLVGSRLIFKSDKIGKWAGEKFTKEYKNIFTILQ